MAVADREEQARGSFEPRMWGAEFAELSAAHREGRLGVEDLERLAVAAYMVGRDDACEAAWIACSGRRPMCIRASSRPGRSPSASPMPTRPCSRGSAADIR